MWNDPVTMAFREVTSNPGHTTVDVFVGRNAGARGLCGTLTLRTDEWHELMERDDLEVLHFELTEGETDAG